MDVHSSTIPRARIQPTDPFLEPSPAIASLHGRLFIRASQDFEPTGGCDELDAEQVTSPRRPLPREGVGSGYDAVVQPCGRCGDSRELSELPAHVRAIHRVPPLSRCPMNRTWKLTQLRPQIYRGGWYRNHPGSLGAEQCGERRLFNDRYWEFTTLGFRVCRSVQ